MAKKGDPLGGQRTGVRQHAAEAGGAATLALLAVSFIPDGLLDPFQIGATASIATTIFSIIAKVLRQRGILPDLTKAAIVLSLCVMISGCALTIGTIDPQELTGVTGETIVACKIKGISFAFGDGGTCATVEGGKISEQAANMIETMFTGVARIVGGIFGGIGAAVMPSE